MQENLVSIIIPTYNRAHLIGQTLASVLAQTYQDWECIVVDDGSNDYTDELMEFYTEKDDRIQYYHRPENRPKGANACRNYGFEISKGEFINWFDSDDLMLPFFLKESKILFHDLKKLNLVITDYDIFWDSNGAIFHRQRNRINNLSLDYFTGKINFGCPHALWKRALVENFQYDENLFRAQELDFHFQILSIKTIRWSKLKERAVLVRRHDKSLTSSYNKGIYLSMKSELEVRRKIIKYLYSNDFNPENITDALQIYLGSLRKFISHFSIKKSFKEIIYLENNMSFNNKFSLWKLELLFLMVFYKLTKRSYRLKLHLKKVNGSFYDI